MLETVSVKLWLAGWPTPFPAVKVIAYVPPVPAAGVPLSTPVDVLKRHAGWQRSCLAESTRRKPAGRHREAAGAADRERRIVGAGDCRSLIDGEREALRRCRANAVGSRACQVVRTAGTGRWCPAQHARRRVKRHSGWQRSRLAESSRRESAGRRP